MQLLKGKDIAAIFPKRKPDSHKGDNGRIMILGGSIDFFGAPILAGLGALYSGADLVHVFVPECNFDSARATTPDLLFHPFAGNYFNRKSLEKILEFSRGCDVILIGPGLGEHEETQQALLDLIPRLLIPTVLDADAIQILREIKKFPLPQKIVITPHHTEFEKMIGKPLKISTPVEQKTSYVRTIATDLDINILLKGPQSFIASEEGEISTNTNGNAGMTVGGSGDVLGGVVASLIGQGTKPADACKIASYVLGKAGENLFKEKHYSYSASDLAHELPYAIRQLLA